MKRMFSLSVTILLLFVFASVAAAAPTDITVRVRSKGAKFIGSSMGGVLITIKDADTGELLARGTVVGGTGDTELIMKQAHRTGESYADTKTAAFTATFDLDAPRYLEIAAFGPLAQRQAANRVTLTQWVVPGKHLTGGDAMMLEMPGLVVDVQSPATHIKLSGTPQTVKIEANVTMMCGCPIEPDGPWGADDIEVRALIRRNGKAYTEISLGYAGRTSQFAADFTITEPGVYDGTVYGYEAATGNTGLDRFTVVVK
ncbi:MAG: hypothetical protein JW781_07905 [Deltaproteobacteria bacterium]|nr:hypothetical protein [Candidatus Anaeroferrophillacea bacterium]